MTICMQLMQAKVIANLLRVCLYRIHISILYYIDIMLNYVILIQYISITVIIMI